MREQHKSLLTLTLIVGTACAQSTSTQGSLGGTQVLGGSDSQHASGGNKTAATGAQASVNVGGNGRSTQTSGAIHTGNGGVVTSGDSTLESSAGGVCTTCASTRTGGSQAGKGGTNAASGGTSSKSGAVGTCATCTGASGGEADNQPMPYPSKAVAIYNMMWSSSGSPKLSLLPANANVVNLAFAQGDPPALVGWASQGESSFVADAVALRAKGVRIIVSVGGAGGGLDVSNRQAFVNAIMAINAKLPLDGLDWDAEGPSMTVSDVVWISTELKRQRGSNFAITMAPNGSNVEEYIAVAVALNDAGALDMIGQQFYDAVVSYDAALGRINQMINAGIPENKVGIGMMVGDADTYWTVDECVAAVEYLEGKRPNLRGGYLWEHGRPGTADWASRVGALLAGP